ncbi:hypothetical protein FRC05_006404 [Tulasnella sp. 425]|nr:hypothetical protein FRC05_006404 [Tulasnella sp. 425]
MNTRFEEKLKVLPEIPKEFGEDGGCFYKYYDTLADEIDEDMVKSLKAQLDGILIFAGLFAGVNSAFLALTLPGMSADPADDTNALLLQFVTGGNGSIHSAEDLPSASFSPPSGIIPVNILFSLSLTLALLAAFLAVLGQQWLVYYRKRSGGGAEAQRWEQLRRYLGAKRWRLEAILDDILPSLLQFSRAEQFISKITQGLLHGSSEGVDTSEVRQHFIITATGSAIRSCTSRTRTAFRSAVEFIREFTRVPIRELERPEDPWTSRSNSESIASWVAKNVPRRAEPVDLLNNNIPEGSTLASF